MNRSFDHIEAGSPVDGEDEVDSTIENIKNRENTSHKEQPSQSSWFSFSRKANNIELTSTTAALTTATVDDPDNTKDSIPEDLLKQVGNMEREFEKSVSNIVDVDTTKMVISDIDQKDCAGYPTISNGSKNSSTDWGMVSDNDDEEDDKGFNFVAVTKSLLMESHSFEQVSENNNQDEEGEKKNTNNPAAAEEENEHSNGRGVLIVDGGEDDDNDHHQFNNANVESSAGTLTIPGSDIIPSDLDTISHQEEIEHLFGAGHSDGSNNGTFDARGTPVIEGEEDRNDGGGSQPQPLVHRFLQNLLSKNIVPNDDYDGDEEEDEDSDDDDFGEDNSILQMDDDDDPLIGCHRYGRNVRRRVRSARLVERSTKRKNTVLKIAGVAVLTTSFVAMICWNVVNQQRQQQDEWKQRLLREEEEKTRLQAEKEVLRLEMEQLQEEAAVAWARADSLQKEQERMKLLQEETEREEERRRKKEQDEELRRSKRRDSCRKHRKRSYLNNDDNDRQNHRDDDFEWFFQDKNGACDSDGSSDDDGTSSFTLADNCWFKAKADIGFGNCGSTTKDFFNDIWDGLWHSSWDDWDNYFGGSGGSGRSNGAMEPYKFDVGSTSTSSGRNYGEKQKQNIAAGEGENRSNRIGSDDYTDTDNQQEQEQEQRKTYNDRNRYNRDNDDKEGTAQREEDPFKELFSVFSSVGHTFATKFTELITDDAVETTRKVAKDLDSVARRGYIDAKETVSKNIIAVKEEVRDMSEEARNDLFDAATITLSSLSKVWEETAKSFAKGMMMDDDENDNDDEEIIPPTLE